MGVKKIPEVTRSVLKNPVFAKSGRKLPPDENTRRCSTRVMSKQNNDLFYLIRRM
jgi:hypothetical protein